MGALAGALSLNGGTLATTATFDTARATTLGAGGGSFNVAAGTNFGITSAVSGSGALSKLGTGTLILGADNTYAGGTTIAAGTLQLGSGAGGSTAGSILGNVSNSGTLAFNRSNTYTYGGIISGANVEQMGSGTTVLTGNSNYTGGTLISAGALQLGAGGATGSISGNVTNNGALVFNRGDTTFGGLISGTGSVTQQGSGTTVLTGNSNYTGGTTISAGTLQLGAGGTTGSIVGDVANNGALVFNRADAYTFGGLISGGGTVTQAGAGTTVLTADNTYAGGTTISAGTLQLGNGGGTGSVAGPISNAGTLVVDRNNNVVLAGPIRGSGKLVQQGVGDTFPDRRQHLQRRHCHFRRHPAVGRRRRLGDWRHSQQLETGDRAQQRGADDRPDLGHWPVGARGRRPDGAQRQQRLCGPDAGEFRIPLYQRRPDRRHGTDIRAADRHAGRHRHRRRRRARGRHPGARRHHRRARHADHQRQPDARQRGQAGLQLRPGRRGGRPAQRPDHRQGQPGAGRHAERGHAAAASIPASTASSATTAR